MDRLEYIQHIQDKLDVWGQKLSVLQDDTDRSDGNIKEEYQFIMRELMRNYEWIESYMDELEQMMDESLAEEKILINDRIDDFEEQLKIARDNIKDI